MKAALFLWAAAALAQEHVHNADAVLRVLKPETGQQIADIGAGRGAFTFPVASAVGPNGKVYAVDIDEKNAVRPLRERIEREHLTNVEVILSKPDDPLLPPAALDAVLVVNAYHEFEAYEVMLGRLRMALKPGGRLVIIDNMPGRTRGQPRATQTKNHMIAPELVEMELGKAGFHITSRDDDIDRNPAMDHTRWAIVARLDDPPPQ